MIWWTWWRGPKEFFVGVQSWRIVLIRVLCGCCCTDVPVLGHIHQELAFEMNFLKGVIILGWMCMQLVFMDKPSLTIVPRRINLDYGPFQICGDFVYH